jgi:hypothetical protein
MTAIIVNGSTPFGALSNELVDNLYAANQAITRLQAAAADAASGFTGTAGAEFEGAGSNFGVVASATPGQQGVAWQYALNVLAQNWATFWAAAQPNISALDNG